MADQKFSDAFTFLSQGAIIQEFKVDGTNITLGFPSAETYQTHNSAFFGENIGRVANRIADATIQRLNGRSYHLVANNGPNTLHGGAVGWGKRNFTGPTPCTRDGKDAVLFSYTSPDGEEGFPGTVEVRVYYTPECARDSADGIEKTSLGIEYEARLLDDGSDGVEETVINLTNHSYFNISGGPTIEGTRVVLPSVQHLVADETAIPTGEIAAYPGFVAGEEFVMGATEPAPDHCFVVDEDAANVPIDTRTRPLRKLISLRHPDTKLHFEALSTEPAFQFYAGKFINVPAIDGQPTRGARSGFCVEASRYVNAINDERWRNMVVLKKGQVYGSKTVYRGWRGE